MRLLRLTYTKPFHPVLAALVLLAISLLFFFWSNPVTLNNSHNETSKEGAGAYHSPLLCI